MRKFILFSIFILLSFSMSAKTQDSLSGSFEKTPLKDVVKFIKSTTDLNVFVAEKYHKIPISVKFKNVRPLELVLLICKTNALAYRIVDGQIILSSNSDVKGKLSNSGDGLQTLNDVSNFYKRLFAKPQIDSEDMKLIKKYLEVKKIQWDMPIGVKSIKTKKVYVFRTSQREISLLGPRTLILDTVTGKVLMSVRK